MEVCGSQEYMQGLEEELNKITLFQKELPLSLQLVTQAIDACRRQLATERTGSGSESVETSSEGGPFLEEFIPIRRDSDSQQEQDHKEDDKSDESHHRDKKTDWLRSVQLWSQDAEASPDEVVDSSEKRSSTSTKKRATSVPSCKENRAPSDIAAAVAERGGASVAARSSNGGDDKEGQLQKKERRCWSPELHRRFLHALQQLGGSHATPKHIKQLMKVDGLTNDEIKSHLQKYRLHTRLGTSPSSPIGNSQPTQIVVVSGVWTVPEIAAAAAAASSGRTPEDAVATIYTPVATTSTTAPETPLRPLFPKTRKRSQYQQYSSNLTYKEINRKVIGEGNGNGRRDLLRLG